jgi:biotin-dependent carboxylase-like uncharacterized protein
MITVLQTGSFTTVQDLGRHGYAHLGVPQAGAADAFSLRVANRLVGNDDNAAALEMTGQGASLHFDTPAFVALAGAAVEATLDGRPLPMYQTIAVPAGATLATGAVIAGWRCYLAVAGGLKVATVLGSAACDSFAALGPPPLAAGMQLHQGASQTDPGFYMRAPPSYAAETCLRILPGPQQDWFVPAQMDVHDLYTVSADSDRTGVRLKGMPLVRERTEEIPSAGVVTGVIQVPGDGQPIVLLSNHGTTGGYPVIAVVISADLSRLAQLAPGSRVRMVRVDRELALAELRAQEQRLADDIVAADASLLAARALIDLAGRHRSLKQAVVGDGQRRIRIRSN